jgi:hypothetical protein
MCSRFDYDIIIKMPRQTRPSKSVKQIADRFLFVSEIHLGIKSSDLWRRLGYANPTTIQAIQKGLTLPDFVRVVECAPMLTDSTGRSINLHWVLTGQGDPMISTNQDSHQERATLTVPDDIIVILKRIKPEKRKALSRFLQEFA